MDPLDREILVLRHYEQMSNVHAAVALRLNQSAASKRYNMVLERFKGIRWPTSPAGISEEIPCTGRVDDCDPFEMVAESIPADPALRADRSADDSPKRNNPPSSPTRSAGCCRPSLMIERDVSIDEEPGLSPIEEPDLASRKPAHSRRLGDYRIVLEIGRGGMGCATKPSKSRWTVRGLESAPPPCGGPPQGARAVPS